MKRFLTLALAAGALLAILVASACSSSDSAAVNAADLETTVLRVKGMTCSGCEVGVKTVVKKLNGIAEVEASYDKGEARVSYDPSKVKPEEIRTAIEKLGYSAELSEAQAKEQLR